MSLYGFDREISAAKGCAALCGVDEAGRGPLAGPVFAAAVILPGGCAVDGLDDSKKLAEKRRESLYDEITAVAACYYVASASAEEIDEINILQASLLAMRRAVEGLRARPDYLLVDGNRDPGFGLPTETVVGGDGKSACIAAASILAKVERDRYMLTLDALYPQYGFAKHKGYPTKLHYEMLEKHGPSPVHRLSFLKKWRGAVSGRAGEAFTADLLRRQGYEILEANYASRYGEIDLIAAKGKTVCFVEVKTRRAHAMVSGGESVGWAKQRKIITTALCYLQERGIELQPRFDVCSVTTGENGGIAGYDYIEGAFDGAAYSER